MFPIKKRRDLCYISTWSILIHFIHVYCGAQEPESKSISKDIKRTVPICPNELLGIPSSIYIFFFSFYPFVSKRSLKICFHRSSNMIYSNYLWTCKWKQHRFPIRKYFKLYFSCVYVNQRKANLVVKLVLSVRTFPRSMMHVWWKSNE